MIPVFDIRFRRLRLLLGVLAVVWLGSQFARAADTSYVEGNVIVTYKPNVDLKGAHANLGKHALAFQKYFPVVSGHAHRHTGLVSQNGRSTADLMAELRLDPDVESVEPDYIRRVNSTPNDTYFTNLWALRNTGQSVNGTTGTSGADMKFLPAWQFAQTGSSQVIVGVVDTGLDYSHADLAANVWTNPNAGHDASGLTGDVHGYDFADGWGDPSDSGYHGTHVAGITAATGYNSAGVIGANPQAKVMSLKVSTDGNSMSSSAIISALEYAATMKNSGVNIVALNASYGGGGFSTTESSAIQAVGNAGIIFCAAAGNGDSNGVAVNNDTTPTYPASYRLSNMIVVAASDQTDHLPSWSNYGATTVDLAAPGVNILSTVPLAGNGLSTPAFPAVTASLQVGANSYTVLPMTYSGSTPGPITDTAYYCGIGNPADFPAAVNGHIALIQRGTLTFQVKAANAAAAGARAVIIYDNVTETTDPFGGTLNAASNGTSTAWLPVVSLSLANGTAIRNLAPVSVTLAVNDSYAYLDGTSMATPQVTAAVAFAAMNFPNETVAQRVRRVLAAIDPVVALQGKVVTGGRLNLQRILNSNANLAALTLSAGTLSPAFASGTTGYTASVPNATTSLTVTPTLADTTASVLVNGVAVVSGTASSPISLGVGSNAISVMVTSQSGAVTNTYTVTVTRAASTVSTLSALAISSGTLTPGFSPGTTSYTASVANTVTSLTVTPTATVGTASIKVNGSSVSSGTASAAIPLVVGTNSITISVTAQDGVTNTNYSLSVTRAASAVSTLSSLVLSSGTLSPSFSVGTTSYLSNVPNTTSSVTVTSTVTDATATIKENGASVASGAASAPITLGSSIVNTITIVVTAQNGTTTTYIVSIDNTPYGIWKKNTFNTVATWSDPKISGDLATPAHDGMANLLKYAMSLDPMTPGVGGLPTALRTGGYLTLTYRKNKSASDVVFTVQCSDSLSGNSWTPATTVVSQSDQGSYWLSTVRDTVPTAGHPRRFMRLQVSK